MKILSIPALACAMTLVFGLASAQAIAPTRVGPVSQYGELLTGKNSQGKGRIYGSCQGVKDGAEVQVRGMSLYWSLNDQALEFWTEEGIASMVKDMKIQLVRGAMATGNEDWTKGQYQGYALKPEEQKGFMKRVIEAAIKQDIYVIIDWHSHIAHEQVESAKGFFREMAQIYGQYDNVIYGKGLQRISQHGENHPYQIEEHKSSSMKIKRERKKRGSAFAEPLLLRFVFVC